MRRRDLEIVDLQQIEGVLEAGRFCRLAMVDSGMPYVVPMCFGYEDGRLFLHSAPCGRKIDVLRRDGRVCFEVTAEAEVLVPSDPCEATVRYSCVIGTGTARMLEDQEEKRHALSVLAGHYLRQGIELGSGALGTVAVIEVAVESMTGKRNPG